MRKPLFAKYLTFARHFEVDKGTKHFASRSRFSAPVVAPPLKRNVHFPLTDQVTSTLYHTCMVGGGHCTTAHPTLSRYASFLEDSSDLKVVFPQQNFITETQLVNAVKLVTLEITQEPRNSPFILTWNSPMWLSNSLSSEHMCCRKTRRQTVKQKFFSIHLMNCLPKYVEVR